ncbi:MAG TPA: MATE family efflux transporter [Pseudomonadales bacterium]|nr:MATE family efflux transporter [Pseudomonadales bacterium]
MNTIKHTLTEWKILAGLGLPILVTQLAQMANGVIDTIMAGHYSARDLAGVAIGNSFWMPVFLFFVGILSALQPTISGHRGAQTLARIVPVTWQGLYIAAISAVLMMFALRHIEPALGWLQLDAPTAAITQGYLNGFIFGIPAMLIIVALRGLTDGLGHTRVMMGVSLLSTVVNLPLNYIFIYGKLGIPAMGGIGCGWATALANWIAMLALLGYLHTSPVFHFSLLHGRVRPYWREIIQLLKLGIPIGFTLFFEVSMFTVIALFLSPLGPVVVAGHQLVLNAVSLMFMVPLSLGMALTLRVSFLVGKGALHTAHHLARSVLLLALCIAMFYVPLLLLGKSLIAALYTNDAEVQHVAVKLLTLAAIFQVADVLQVAAISALRGFRDTRIPMLIIFLSFWGVGMPLGYLLTFTNILVPAMGAAGFWIGLIAGIASASVLLLIRLFRFTAATPYFAEKLST